VERLGDVAGGPRPRTLEEQVLEEVRGAADLRRLVPGAGQHPETERDRADAVHALGDDPEPRFELGPPDRHVPEPSGSARLCARGPARAGGGRRAPLAVSAVAIPAL